MPAGLKEYIIGKRSDISSVKIIYGDLWQISCRLFSYSIYLLLPIQLCLISREQDIFAHLIGGKKTGKK